MRVSKIILTMTLILLMTVSTITHAQVFDETQDLRGVDYDVDLHGSNTVFCGVGYNGEAYTTLTNTYTSPLYLSVNVREFVYDEGYGPLNSKSANINPGLQLESNHITRYTNSYVRHYYHSGTASVSSHYPSQVDDYTFIANQYYN